MSKPAATLVATFVAAPGVKLPFDLGMRALAGAGIGGEPQLSWLSAGEALDATFQSARASAELCVALESCLSPAPIDVIVQPQATRRKKLLVADMDATILVEESLDELAGRCGLRDEVERVTAQAMRGDIDFEAALATRVALFAGRPAALLQDLAQTLRASPGAQTLVATMRAHGAFAALVSGGFVEVAQPVSTRLGFDDFFANRLEVVSGRLTGRVTPPIRSGPAKAQTLAALRQARGLSFEETLAVGDGANDLEMLACAGLGVAYRAKPRVAAAAAARLRHADLAALLFAQGFSRREFVAA